MIFPGFHWWIKFKNSARLSFVLTNFRDFQESKKGEGTVSTRFLLVVSDDPKNHMEKLARKNGMAPAKWARLAVLYAIEHKARVLDVADPVKPPGRPRKYPARVAPEALPSAA